jgi:hypothetical protein
VKRRSCHPAHNPPTRKWKNLVIVAAGCICTMIAAAAFFAHDRQPSYRGSSLHEWLTLYRSGPEVQDRYRVVPVEWAGESPTTNQKQAAAAIRQIGTNALPWLLKWLGYKRPPWKDRAYASLSRFNRWRFGRWASGKFSIAEEIDLHGCAMLGLAILGPEANSEVRGLLRLAEDPVRCRNSSAPPHPSPVGILNSPGLPVSLCCR